MKIYPQCLVCSLQNFLDLLERSGIPEEEKDNQISDFLRYMGEMDYSLSPPLIARHTQKKMRQLLGLVDLYLEDKQRQNRAMLEIEPVLRKKIAQHHDPVLACIHLAISGNVIDLGTRHGLEMEKTIEQALDSELAKDQSKEMLDSIRSAGNILYLADNAGEIVLDNLLIENIIEHKLALPEQITLAVRGAPVLNDVTLSDLADIRLPEGIKIISNGDSTPGTWLPDTSDEFRQIWSQADVIISKGQGNYETLSLRRDKPIYFMLIAKCRIVAKELSVNLGDFICMRAQF